MLYIGIQHGLFAHSKNNITTLSVFRMAHLQCTLWHRRYIQQQQQQQQEKHTIEAKCNDTVHGTQNTLCAQANMDAPYKYTHTHTGSLCNMHT